MADTLEPAPAYVLPRADFEDVYRQEYPNLVAVGYALTGEFQTGEDLVQETMVKAYLQWNRVSRFHRPGAWCLRVLTNACRRWGRRRQTAARYLAAQRRIEACHDGPSVEYVELWAAVRRLPRRPRLAVVLYYIVERSVADVASILQVPEETVKSDLARSRVALMRELER